MTSTQQLQQQQNNRRQIMQPWPLCLAGFGKPKERSILPKQYSRVPTITRAATPSQLAQDCSSNTTLLTQVSPFNSQVTLEDNQKGVETSVVQQHYYADNLRNNHHKALNGSKIYDPNNKEYCKQLDPLLGTDETPSDTKILMDSKDFKKPTTPALSTMIPQFQKEMRSRRPYYSTQVLAAFAVSIGSMVVGFASCYTSPATESLKDRNITDFEVSKDMTSWIGSIMPASAVAGAIIGGALIEYLGRRNTILSLSVPFFFSWILIGMATNVSMVLAGRSLSGFCVGVLTLAMPVYLGETMKPEVRGTLGLMPTAIGNIGMMLCNVVGFWCNWWELALASALIPIPFAVLMMMVPETPRWYIAKGKAKRAKKALQWLRGRNADVSEELQAIERMQVDSERQASQSDTSELFRPANLKPLAISLGLMFFQQMSGINAVMFYTESIFAESGSSIPKKYCVLVVNVVNFLATFVAAALIDRLGRKLLLYVSSLSMIVSLAVLGAAYYLRNLHYSFTGLDLLPLICLVVYVLGFSLGFGPVPWLMMGEILPARVRGSAASIVTCFNWSCTFIVTKVFVNLVENIGNSGTFWLACGICIVGLVFVFFFVPETSGRSLEEIERGLTGQNVRRMSSVANIKPTPMAC